MLTILRGHIIKRTMKISTYTIWILRTVGGVLLMHGTQTFAQDTIISGSSYFGGENNEAYLKWLEQSSYSKSSFLLSSQDDAAGVALHWKTDEQNIHIAVAAKATGWVGLGLAESGSMKGADIVMFTAETDTLVDSYVLDQLVKPFPDDCQSWTLNNSTTDGGFIIFEATRLMDTKDSQDRIILDDSNVLVPATRLIAAWGDTATPSFHGSNTARNSVRFFGSTSIAEEIEAFDRAMEAEAEGNFTIQAEAFVVPNEDTHYAHFCFSEADLLAMNVPINQDLHTIGIEPVVTSPYVHHFIVTGSTDPFDSNLDCEEEFPGFETGYVWAPGDLPLNLPSNVGGPLGTSGFRSFRLEIHYNNPELDVGSFDSSGVRFYYTSQKRQHDLGILQVGDPNVELYGELVSPNGGLSQHVFYCGSSCTSNHAQAEVTVIREHLHMHATGVSMFNAQIRNGKVLREGAVQVRGGTIQS